jgi:hypothetical protein
VFEALYAGKVPAAWLKAYPSLKGLGPWTRDLLARIEQLARWAEGSYPRIYWLGGFTYPTGFVTAVLQVRVVSCASHMFLRSACGCWDAGLAASACPVAVPVWASASFLTCGGRVCLLLLLLLVQTTARRNGIPIDSLVFEHGVVNLDEREINGPPKEGVYVKGLFLEGETERLSPARLAAAQRSGVALRLHTQPAATNSHAGTDAVPRLLCCACRWWLGFRGQLPM